MTMARPRRKQASQEGPRPASKQARPPARPPAAEQSPGLPSSTPPQLTKRQQAQAQPPQTKQGRPPARPPMTKQSPPKPAHSRARSRLRRGKQPPCSPPVAVAMDQPGGRQESPRRKPGQRAVPRPRPSRGPQPRKEQTPAGQTTAPQPDGGGGNGPAGRTAGEPPARTRQPRGQQPSLGNSSSNAGKQPAAAGRQGPVQLVQLSSVVLSVVLSLLLEVLLYA